MEQSFVQRELDILETRDNSGEQLAKTSRKPVKPSYHPTRWGVANRLLDVVDRVTNGRAGVFQRLFSYLFIGGTAALVNLILFTVLYRVVPMPFDSKVHDVIASTVAFEVSLMANFIPNDYFTFRHLPGHQRSWFARCARFHVTAIGGYVLTLVLQFCFHFFLGLDSVISQAAAIWLVLIYNFTVHHLFTYRHLKTPTAKQPTITIAKLQDTNPIVDSRELAAVAATEAAS